MKEGKRNTKGCHYYLNGDFYEGEWLNDKRIGKGKLMFQDGSHLISQFIDDQADGHGIYEDKYGNSFQSIVQEDKDGSGETGAIRNGKLFE